MHPYFDDYWPWYTAAWTLDALGGLLLAWALFWDRAKRGGLTRHRCPKCWYDLQGIKDSITEESKCSECGRKIKRFKNLLHTRRHGRGVLIALLVFLNAYTVQCLPRKWNYGNISGTPRSWPAFIPSSLLIFAPMPEQAPLIDLYEDDGIVWQELHMRHGDDETPLWMWQNSILAWRVRRHLQHTTPYGVREEERQTFEKLANSPYTGPHSVLDFNEFSTVIQETTGIPVVARDDLVPINKVQVPRGVNHNWTALETLFDGPMSALFNRFNDWTIDDDHVLVMPKEDLGQYNCVVMYDISDLIQEDYGEWYLDVLVQDFKDLVMETVALEDWKDYGGDLGHMGSVGHHLIVHTTVRSHLAIEQFLELLRRERSVFSLHAPAIINSPMGHTDLCIPLVTRVHEIGDLVSTEDEEIEELYNLLTEMLVPDHWMINGGDIGSIQYHQSRFVVTTTRIIHDHIEQLLRLLRIHDAPPMIPLKPIDPKEEQLPAEYQIRAYPIAHIAKNPPVQYYSTPNEAPEDHLFEADVLADHLLKTIEPEHWAALGGEHGSLQYFNDTLVILTTIDNHEAIAQRLAAIHSKMEQGVDLTQALASLEEETPGKPDG